MNVPCVSVPPIRERVFTIEGLTPKGTDPRDSAGKFSDWLGLGITGWGADWVFEGLG
jgi:hypothetical protein